MLSRLSVAAPLREPNDTELPFSAHYCPRPRRDSRRAQPAGGEETSVTRMGTYSHVMRDPRAPAGSGPRLVTSDVQLEVPSQWAGPGRPAATLSNLNRKEGRWWCRAGATVIVRAPGCGPH
jgi:hypothetical protein